MIQYAKANLHPSRIPVSLLFKLILVMNGVYFMKACGIPIVPECYAIFFIWRLISLSRERLCG